MAVQTKAKYRRVVLKLSGEALLGDREFGISPEYTKYLAEEIRKVRDLGVQVAVGGRAWVPGLHGTGSFVTPRAQHFESHVPQPGHGPFCWLMLVNQLANGLDEGKAIEGFPDECAAGNKLGQFGWGDGQARDKEYGHRWKLRPHRFGKLHAIHPAHIDVR